MSRKTPFLPVLSGMRFLAACMILGCHYIPAGPAFPFIESVLRHAYLMVNWFFIASGFLLAYNYPAIDGAMNAKAFILNRLIRIYPLYVFSIIFAVPLMVYYRQHEQLASIPFVLVMNLLSLQTWFPITSLIKFNCAIWVISCEIFFYLLFPFISRDIMRMSLKGSVILFALVWVLDSAVYFIAPHILPSSVILEGRTVSFSWDTMPLINSGRFVMGIVLCNVYLRAKRLRAHEISPPWAYLFLVMTVFPVLGAFDTGFSQFVIRTGIVNLLLAGSVLLGAISGERRRGSATHSIAVFLGKISFALFLFQIPLWHYYEHIYVDVLGSGSPQTVRFVLFFLVTVFVSSVLLFWCVEVPAGKSLRRLLRPTTDG
jgi:peptidoglycan/LPS O-acetylase OafA/YrhL